VRCSVRGHVSYIELHTSSAFSFLRAASLPEMLVERAAALGYPALALLDRDGVYGAPRFYKAAKAAGLRALVGSELTITAGSRQSADGSRSAVGRRQTADEPSVRTADSPLPTADSRRPTADCPLPSADRLPPAACRLPTWPLSILVESQEGWRNLCRLISHMKLRSPKGEGALGLDELEGATGGLVALVGRSLLETHCFGVGGLLDRLIGIFGRDHVYVELQRHLRRDQEADNDTLACLAAAFRVPVIATGGVAFATPEERPLFDVLTCVREHTTLAMAGRRLAANAERYLKPAAQMARLFADRPDAVHATRELADRLAFSMDDLGYRFPRYPVPPGETEISFLRRLVDIGARDRYRPYHDAARAQIARELDLIEKLELAGYFLIVWDIVNYCRQQDILVQGRGSAANSAVCYSLGITAIDPVGMKLLFERFLSAERGEWPDIDLDLPSGDRRERVIQHVYQKYGKHGAAMTANVITYRGRSAAREVGKVLDLDPSQIDRLAKVMNQFEFIDPGETLARNIRVAGLEGGDVRVQLFAGLWRQIQDLPRHLGQHSGGMVICQGELSSVVPLENASMPDRVVVQWDKDDCADMGLIKVDLLGLGMMAVLQDAIRLVNDSADGSRQTADHDRQTGDGSRQTNDRSGLPPADCRLPSADSRLPSAVCPLPSAESFDLAHLPQDPAVYAMLQAADTVGVFQVESRAQMATLPRLKPECFYDLVVEVAIIRPGPIVGQMVHPYLNRRAGLEKVSYPHPSLEPVLERTLGVPLFQEQLLRMAMIVAGFTGGQAEELRRAMGFKRSEKRMRQIEAQLREGMAKNGITAEAAERIVLAITSFALYGFPESHAASFALLAYASAYLKLHYPAAFYTALLNNQPMGFYHPATLVKDAQRRGVRFAPIDVQVSEWDCTVEHGMVRLGLRYVNGLREDVGKAIAAVLCRGGSLDPPTQSLDPPTQSLDLPTACPKCGCDDSSMLEESDRHGFCNVCSHQWPLASTTRARFRSLEDLVRQTGIRRDEIRVLAEIGALNTLGGDRRSALWQVERVIRPAGKLFEGVESEAGSRKPEAEHASEPFSSPLAPMTESERLVADYAGMRLTIGPHPMTFRRHDLSMRGVLRAIDLPRGRMGRRVRTAGMVITRQRPGTAKGFVFLTLEDETGIANVIVRPDLFDRERLTIVGAPFLLVEGILQNQDGATAIRAERVYRLQGLEADAAIDSHDFH
jgi:error-prone DNA polymerase